MHRAFVAENDARSSKHEELNAQGDVNAGLCSNTLLEESDANVSRLGGASHRRFKLVAEPDIPLPPPQPKFSFDFPGKKTVRSCHCIYGCGEASFRDREYRLNPV